MNELAQNIFYRLSTYTVWNDLDNQVKDLLTEAINIGIDETQVIVQLVEVNKMIDETIEKLKLADKIVSQLEAQVGEILADFENLLIEIMSNRKCSIGSIDNYYDLHLEVKKINELYSKLQYYHIVSQKLK